VVKFTPEGTETQQLVDIDHPPPEPEAVIPARETTPEPIVSGESSNRPAQPDVVLKNGDEWSSPAFIKRARTSYGSLFDTGYDPFAEEDGTIPGKGRKRSRLSSAWRYVSRSPSPEEEESALGPSATRAPAPNMADEGSQTVALDIRDTIEGLVHSYTVADSTSKNVETSVSANGHQQFSSHLPEIRTTETVPPAKHTNIGLNTADVIQQVHIQEDTPTQVPNSPRLQPIPSDTLPQVSPLLTSKSSLFPQNVDGIKDTSQLLGEQPINSPTQGPTCHTEDGQSEPFPTNDIDHLGEQHIPEYPTIHDHTMDMNETANQSFESQLVSNGQFGQWQSTNAQPSLSESGHDEPPHESLYVDGVEEGHHARQQFEENLRNELSKPQSQESSYHSYPLLDSELRTQSVEVENPWQLDSASIPYPDLSSREQEGSNTENNIRPSPSSLSRMKDAQSVVVDLTESEDDLEEREASERSIDNRAGEHSIEAEGDEDEEDEEEEEEEEEDSVEAEIEEEEAIDDQMSERDADLHHRGYSVEEEHIEDEGMSEEYSEEDFSDADGEEEAYDDEDMEVDEPQRRPPVQSEPVVIDLLSSDEEDNGETPRSPPPAAKSHQRLGHEQESESGEEEDDDESGIKIDDEQEVDHDRGVPFSHRSDVLAGITHDTANERSGEDEDAAGTFKDDDMEAENGGDIDELYEDADKEEHDLQAADKDDIPQAHANDISKDQTTVPAHQAVVSSVPAQSQSTDGEVNDAKSPVEVPAPVQTPSLLARMFNLDGANDEPAAISSFPILAKKVAAPNPTPDSNANSQVATIDQIHSPVQGGVQLPTPDATQVSIIKDSQESLLLPGQPNLIENSQTSEIAQPSDMNVEENTETAPEEGNDIQIDVREVEKEAIRSLEVEAIIKKTTAVEPTKEDRSEIPNDIPESMNEKPVDESQKTTRVSPRRSRRITSRSAAQIAEIMRPPTPDDSGNLEKHAGQAKSPAAPDSRNKQGDYDQSDEIAMAEPKSSPRTQHDLRSNSVVDLKLSLSRALRTDLSEFTALKALRYHLNKKLDIMAIVTTTPAEPQRSKGGPRHYQITFNIIDSSIAPNGITEVQVFRPYKEALPVVKEGDGILLRNFQVIAIKAKGFALRSENSEACSWAVFKDGVADPEIRGPPVELGDAEKNHVAAMREWYGTLDTTSVAKLNRANADKSSGVGKGITR
jgi:hypothetical protein